jgi:hypothetical protein
VPGTYRSGGAQERPGGVCDIKLFRRVKCDTPSRSRPTPLARSQLRATAPVPPGSAHCRRLYLRTGCSNPAGQLSCSGLGSARAARGDRGDLGDLVHLGGDLRGLRHLGAALEGPQVVGLSEGVAAHLSHNSIPPDSILALPFL